MTPLKKAISLTFVTLLLSSFHASAQAFSKGVVGDGEINKRVYLLDNFRKVSVSSGISLFIDPSGKKEATLVTDKNIINLVEVKQKGNTIYFNLKGKVQKSTKGVNVYLSYKTLTKIKTAAGSNIFMINDSTILKAKKIRLDASGGANFHLNIDVKKLSCNLSGGCGAFLKGSATSAHYNISGGGVISAKDLSTASCSVDASGGPAVTVTTTECLSVDASGGAFVSYYGNPKKTSISNSGGSNTVKR